METGSQMCTQQGRGTGDCQREDRPPASPARPSQPPRKREKVLKGIRPSQPTSPLAVQAQIDTGSASSHLRHHHSSSRRHSFSLPTKLPTPHRHAWSATVATNPNLIAPASSNSVAAMAHSCLRSTTSGAAILACPAVKTVSSNPRQASVVRCAVQRKGEKMMQAAAEMPRREALAAIALSGALSWLPASLANAAGLPPGPPAAKLCDGDCEKELDNIPLQTTQSGLQYKDIVVGAGENPLVGFQVAANYVAMVPGGKIFDSSLEKGIPYIFRVGAGAIIKGLDEGILSMKVGGKRRLYIPGELAYPKGLGAAAGRPRVPPSSPVIFDVSLLYIPGISELDTE